MANSTIESFSLRENLDTTDLFLIQPKNGNTSNIPLGDLTNYFKSQIDSLNYLVTGAKIYNYTSTGITYNPGDLVVYNNKIYKKLTDIPAQIDSPTDWECISTSENLYKIGYSDDKETLIDLTENPDATYNYIGIYIGSKDEESLTASDFDWAFVKGDTGPQGPEGHLDINCNQVVISKTIVVNDWIAETVNLEDPEDEPLYSYSYLYQDDRFKSDMAPTISLNLDSVAANDIPNLRKEYTKILRAICEDGYICFYCNEKPDTALPLLISLTGILKHDNFVSSQEFNTYKTFVNNRISGIKSLIIDNDNINTDFDIWIEYGKKAAQAIENDIEASAEAKAEANAEKVYLNQNTAQTIITNLSNCPILVNDEKAAKFASYVSTEIANSIFEIPTAFKTAVLSSKSNTYQKADVINRSFENLLENNCIVQNTPITDASNLNYDCSDSAGGYSGYHAFDGILDNPSAAISGNARHIWISHANEQWVEYKYDTPVQLYGIRIYSTRSNAPLLIKVEASNDGNIYTTLASLITLYSLEEQNSPENFIGIDKYKDIILPTNTAYVNYRFTILQCFVGGNSTVGEINIYTFTV